MRRAAGIILIILGLLFLCLMIELLVVFNISFLLASFAGVAPLKFIPAVVPISLVVPVAFHVSGGIFCLRRKYWRVCLASASFAVLLLVFNPWESLLRGSIIMSLIPWAMLVAAVISVVFISRTRKEWQGVTGPVGCEVSNGVKTHSYQEGEVR